MTAKKKYKIKIDREKCKGCELCLSVCKKNVFRISEKFNKMGYRFAEVVNEENCTGCASCAIICPDACIEIKKIKPFTFSQKR